MKSNIKQIVTKEFLLLNLCFVLSFSPVFLFLLFPLHLKDIGAFKYQIGIAMGIFSIGALLSKPYVGVLIDSKGRKITAYIGYSISVLTLFLMLLVDSIPFYYLLRFFFGIGMSLSMTSIYTFLFDISPPNMLGQTAGLFGIGNFISNAVFTVIGEYFVSLFGFSVIFWISIVNVVCSCWILSSLRERERVATAAKLSFFSIFTGPLKFLLLSSVVFASVHASLYSFIALYLRELKFTSISMFFVFYALGAIVLRIFFGYLIDEVAKEKIITINLLLYCVTLIVIALYPSPLFVFAAAFLGGVSHGFLFPSLNAAIVGTIGKNGFGVGMSAFFLAIDFGFGIAPFLFGFFSGILGYAKAYLYISFFLFIFSIVIYTLLKKNMKDCLNLCV